MTKFALFAVSVQVTACGGATEPQAVNPFKQAVGKQLPAQGLAVSPKDPFAPMLVKKEN